jgi:CheY-like chemotaxis protein
VKKDSLLGKKPLVLCVDDNVQFLLLISTVLETAGFSVIGSNDPLDALQICTKTMPDLVLVDYDMPNMNGGELARALKEHNCVLPIVLFSGNPSVPSEALLCIDRYLCKGSDVGLLLETLRAVSSSLVDGVTRTTRTY